MIQTYYQIRHEIPRRIRVHLPVLYDPSLDRTYFEATLGAIEGIDNIRINPKLACVVISHDGKEKTRTMLLDSLSAVSEECFKQVNNDHETMDTGDLAVKLTSALLTPYLNKKLKMPISWAMGMPVISEGLTKTLTEGIKVETLDATAILLSLLRREYFTSNMIVALLSLGKYLEQLTEEQTSSLLKSLLQPKIESVWVERQGKETRITIDQVKNGDLVICGTGEMIPIDGKVHSGDASLNQSSITGESVPANVSKDDEVLSGSVIEEGKIVVRAEKVGKETTVARISSFLVNSLRTKSNVQKQSDKLADSLVPITFALGLAIQLVTRDIKRTAAVFTVDYSCVIKLANPIAVKMAMYQAAHKGVLLKGSGAIDLLSRVDTVIFDKTGTLTKGQMIVSEIKPARGLGRDALLSMAAAAEEHYTHPVAKAVVKAAREKNLDLPPLSQVDFVVAHGVSAYVNGKRILVGSHHFIAEDEGVDCSWAEKYVADILKQGKSPLYVAREGKLAGIIVLQDAVRKEAKQVLQRLKKSGVKKIVVLSGDTKEVVESLGKEIGVIDELHWELKPEEKAAIVEEMHQKEHCIAFAGDGVNDSPALLTADVGICMPNGADLAKESAQVVLLNDNLEALATAREIAVHTQDIIKNCLYASVGVNSILLLLATMGKIPPVASALMHNLTTVGVLSYAAMGHNLSHVANMKETIKKEESN